MARIIPYTDQEAAAIRSFNPEMVYVMRRPAVQALLLKTPIPALWRGRTYRVTARHIAAGVYEVTGKFDRAQPLQGEEP